MSLLIASIDQSSALVAVDTIGRMPGGAVIHMTKLFPLPHIGPFSRRAVLLACWSG